MRTTLFCFILMILVSSAHSQLRVAIVGGAQSSSVNETNSQPDFNTYKKGYSPRTGVHFGFIADVPFSVKSKLFFQPGVIFYNKGRKFADSIINSPTDVVYRNATQYINYIDIPLNLVLKIPVSRKTKFMIGAGPYASFFYNGKETENLLYGNGNFASNENNDLPVGKNVNQYRTFDYGVNGLAGFEFGRVFLTANYSRSIGDFYTTDYSSLKHQLIGGTLGIYLGEPIALEPKVKDKDKDGIPDDKDMCPDQPGPAITNGCPDKDGDGVADKDDKCPDVAGLVKFNGCPDTDNDGIPDNEDKCPTVPGIAKYNGCPVPDTDGDGINDENDKCPTIPGLAKYNGCPIPDTDGDGINDEEDKCPTVPGIKENNGCPEIKKEIVEKVNYAAKKIQFKVNKAELLPSSLAVLDSVAQLLQNDPGLHLMVEGHTSSEGTLEYNMQLSEQRAMAVKSYLESKGVDPARIEAKGFGPTQLLNSDKTAAEKAINRRVELKLSNQ